MEVHAAIGLARSSSTRSEAKPLSSGGTTAMALPFLGLGLGLGLG